MATMNQKKLDAETAAMSSVATKHTQVKALLNKLPDKAMEEMVEKHQLHGIKRKMLEGKLPERRPTWITS